MQVRDEHWAGVVVRHRTCGCGIGWSFGICVISAYDVGEFWLTFGVHVIGVYDFGEFWLAFVLPFV